MLIFLFQAVQNIKPLFDRVLIERAVAETKTKGGIVVPEKSLGKVLEGTIVAAGPGYRTESGQTVPLSLAVGDKVLLPEYGGTKVKVEDKEYYVFRETDIVAKLA